MQWSLDGARGQRGWPALPPLLRVTPGHGDARPVSEATKLNPQCGIRSRQIRTTMLPSLVLLWTDPSARTHGPRDSNPGCTQGSVEPRTPRPGSKGGEGRHRPRARDPRIEEVGNPRP